MAKVISRFRIEDDREVRIYRPGMVVEGADEAFAIKNGFAISESKAEPRAPANKAKKAAPENK